MRALVPTGEPDVLVAPAEVPDPAPTADEAVVRVVASSLNRADLLYLTSAPRLRPHEAWRPGDDVAGVVVAAAADGSGPAVGDRVVGHSPAGGGWAEYAAVATDRVAALVPGVDFATAAALPTAGTTAARLVRAAGPLLGRRVLLTGATGGVGHYVVELAAAAGAEVTAVAAPTEPWQRLPELGAEVVHDVADARAPFDVVLESVGGTHLTSALAKLRRGGLALWFGQASGTPVTLDFFAFFQGYESVALRQFTVYGTGDRWDDDLATLVRLTAAGRLHPQVDHRVPWHRADDALRLLANRELRGKAVIDVEG
ncbi:zinc-binding dehydrogenase [Saccharothrix obliqua]|uniref:zinc-binding dehydrogenase n=1 Tax=Saccharothrix obliqua TaxID=2861747 RepID=UPI001C5FCCBA|nr:zinc-binding dehydrogenase [Saccharothrix obliqua]MBW4718676.1 zinc-binding dehydrogenase [Saccharothrix obliqua]